MSGSSQKPWSSNPNAPQISYYWYFEEKTSWAGSIISTILYGIVVAQFFQCMSALLDRTKRDIKWGLVVHTVVMFSCVTIYTAGGLYLQSISYIDDRGFPGDHTIPPGPIGYQFLIITDPLNSVCYVVFYLNQWLADGLLLYRYCVIFAMNYWFITLPCLMYLASVALGITFVCQTLRPGTFSFQSVGLNIGLSFYAISVSLNVLLTLMIATRLILHNRSIRRAMGTARMSGGLYNAVVTMLIESCAIYAVTYLLYIGPWSTKNSAQLIFSPILTVAQVIGPFLIIQRVADQTAVTSNALTSGNVGSIHFKSRGESTVGNGILGDGDPMSSMDTDGEIPGELGIGVEGIHTIDEVNTSAG